eukprot:GGOE01020524.1.p1 GENE.GGOE01020524.1~~GGOE01020524.1.p1  ORF type:complete len:425 (+),score=118.73 GGOE01020524.1:90-1364(+)
MGPRNVPCYFYQRGACNRPQCQYLHVMSPPAQHLGQPPLRPQPNQTLPTLSADEPAAPEVYINLKPYLLPFDSRVNVHALFAPGFILLDADGLPVPLNDHGLTVQPLPPSSHYTTDGSQAAPPPAYDDTNTGTADTGTSQCSPEVLQRLDSFIQSGVLAGYDEGLWARLSSVPEAEAVEVLDEVATQDMTNVRNPAAYIVGILRSRERCQEPETHAGAPEVLERLEALVQNGTLLHYDADLWERVTTIPAAEAMQLLDEVDATDFSSIRNRAAYIIGMIRMRERMLQGAGISDPQTEWPADWVCMACGMVNFARRTECFRCAAPALAEWYIPDLDLFVGNVAPELSEGALFDHFSQFGTVTGIELSASDVPGRPGVVHFSSPEEVQAAVALSNRHSIGAHEVSVSVEPLVANQQVRAVRERDRV